MVRIVAYQGVHGAYSYIAACDLYPKAKYLSCLTFRDVFDAVQSGKADVAVIPVENSNAGRVADVHFLLSETNLYIEKEYFLRIRHQLIGLPEAEISNVKFVHSHIQALMQCGNYLTENSLEAIPEEDTSLSCNKILELNDVSHAAIASDLAAKINGLKVLQHNIENEGDNTTRFLVMKKQKDIPVDDNGEFFTSLIFTTKNLPAALYKALGAFATNNINIVRIESYMPGGHFVPAQFYVEAETHIDRKDCKNALLELATYSDKINILGVYRAHSYRDL
ncbi:MAG: prephenate dehydratase [Alphaproteobacteria bacterium]|nr:prephenate dehydratase [Alphaproteobacteria bacterium]